MSDHGAAGAPPLWLFALGFVLAALPLATGLHMDDYTNVLRAREATWDLPSLGTSFLHGGRDSQDGYLPAGYERPVAHYFRPLLVALFKLEGGWFGLDGLGYHAVNLALQLVNVGLLWLLGRRLAGPTVASWAVVLFLFHGPSGVAAAWISGRTEVALATLVLATLLLYARFRDGAGYRWLAAAAATLTLAQFVKEQALVLPVLLALYDRLAASPRRFTGWPLLLLAPVLAVGAFRLSLPGVNQLPPASFYFHPPGEPGFALHLVGRLGESILSLVQVGSFTILPYGRLTWPPLLAGVLGAAAAVAWLVWGAVQAPKAPFLISWVVVLAAPTFMCTQLPLYLYLPALASSLLLAHLAGPGPLGPDAPLLRRHRRLLAAAWILVGTLSGMYSSSWLHRKCGEQVSLVDAALEGDAPGPLRVYLVGASLPDSGMRSHLRLRRPGEVTELHVLTLSSVLLGPREVEARWVVPPRPGEPGARLRVDEGDRHPYDNDRFRWLHARPIDFGVGASYATSDYRATLGRDEHGYFWEVVFTAPWASGSVVVVSGPRGAVRLTP